MSILEFPKARGGLDEDATRGRVWIFSGISHLHTVKSALSGHPWDPQCRLKGTQSGYCACSIL